MATKKTSKETVHSMNAIRKDGVKREYASTFNDLERAQNTGKQILKRNQNLKEIEILVDGKVIDIIKR